MKDLTTQELKDELTRRGYYTSNLWHIDDVKGRFEATDDEFEDIFDCADEYKLKEINETI
jgi:inner membrane protein involved in colicin E2 resistance